MANQAQSCARVYSGKTWGPSRMKKGHQASGLGGKAPKVALGPAQVTVQGPRDKTSSHSGVKLSGYPNILHSITHSSN